MRLDHFTSAAHLRGSLGSRLKEIESLMLRSTEGSKC